MIEHYSLRKDRALKECSQRDYNLVIAEQHLKNSHWVMLEDLISS